MKKNKNLISIIIRTYNEQYWLPKLLEKIKEQNYKDYDVILVDNGSSDKTKEIFKYYFSKSTIININHFNPARAINLGIKKSKSDYIVIVSAHCIPKDKNWLSNLAKNMENEKVVACYGRQLPLITSDNSDKRDLLNTFGIERRVQRKDTFFHNANSIIKKSFWKKYPFDESLDHIEDRVWAKEVIKQKKHIVYEPKAAVYHYHGINHSKNPERARKIAEILTKHTSGNTKSLPSFLQFVNSKTLYCILGYDKKNKKIFNKILRSIKQNKNTKHLFVYGDLKINDFNKNDNELIPFKKQKSFENLTFIEVLKRLLQKSYKMNFYPDCLCYINLNSDHLDPSKVNDAIKFFYSKMYDTVFFGETAYKQIWSEKGNTFHPVKTNFDAPKQKKIPYYIAEYGMGTATKPEIIDGGSLTGEKVAIMEL